MCRDFASRCRPRLRDLAVGATHLVRAVGVWIEMLGVAANQGSSLPRWRVLAGGTALVVWLFWRQRVLDALDLVRGVVEGVHARVAVESLR